jgi:hypothetical protein
MKNKFIKISFSFLALLLMLSCSDNDDYTNDSVVTATSPSLAVSLGFSNATTLIEQEASYSFSVSITEAQIADVIVYLEQTDGTATAGEDFSMPNSVTIKKGTLSASSEITIHADELPEDEETVTIQIGLGNESNVSGVAGETVTFNIANLTDGDLVVGMSWAASSAVTDNYGTEIDAYALADLRLLLTDSPYTTVFESADGASAETYVLSGTAPDITYSFVADFYAAMYEISADIDITLTFDQVGKINGQTHSFSSAFNTTDSCLGLNYVMANVTKDGNSYSFEEVGQKSSLDLKDYAGNWSVDTPYHIGLQNDFTAEVTAEALFIDGIGQDFILNFWGETPTTSAPVEITLNADGTVNIARQYVYTADYNGDLYDYEIEGSGTWNGCGDKNMLDLVYDIYYPGDADGIAKTYAAYLNYPYIGGTFTLD